MVKYQIVEREEFSQWLSDLKDVKTRLRLIKRLRRASLGNLGDVRSVGDGLFEMREFFGPGWRMYYIQRHQLLVVMLGGGEKSTQVKDIQRAKALAQEVTNE
ncbi:MAG: type II toxin-antitoxin system RelE/ParE family toxin [Desulfuromonas sp.]|nr:type II toxin-antitoxin system RelE/ParE family toxin [Desulfuromonas sp.]